MKFKYQLNPTQRWFLLLVLLPFQYLCAGYICNALVLYVSQLAHLTLDRSLFSILINFVFELFEIIVCCILFKNILKSQLHDLKHISFTKILKIIFSCVFIGLALNIIGGIIAGVLSGLTISSNQESLNTLIDYNKSFMLVEAVITGPICEELFYRVGIYGFLSKYNKTIALIGSSVLFGSSHILNAIIKGNISEFPMAIPYIFVGFVLGYSYQKSENVTISIIVHAMMNFVSVVL